MKLRNVDHVDWTAVNDVMHPLFIREQQADRYASYDIVSEISSAPKSSKWRQFLLKDDNLEVLINQVISIADRDTSSFSQEIGVVRRIVEESYRCFPHAASSFLRKYLPQRSFIPAPLRGIVDGFVISGEKSKPLSAASFAYAWNRIIPSSLNDKLYDQIYVHWYQEIIDGRVTLSKIKKIPKEILDSIQDISRYLKKVDEDNPVDENTVCERYVEVFKSKHIPSATAIIIQMHRFSLLRHIEGKFDISHIEPFLNNFSKSEVMRRFKKLDQWISKFHKTNHDGTVLTPPLIDFLSQKVDFDILLNKLDYLRDSTRKGKFQFGNILQRDLEFRRFEYEYTRVLEPLSYELRGRYPAPKSGEELYGIFNELPQLLHPVEENFNLVGQHLAEVGRVVYEAVGFLKFLKSFREKTSRHIMVIGNDRYGRQWCVEPIEGFLGDGFSFRYFRVRSGTASRMSVPFPFTKDFVKEINDKMPHIVIADACHPLGDSKLMPISRALRDYAKWFYAFNDIRARGDLSIYQNHGPFPEEHLSEMMKWHEYVAVRQQLREWVTPGRTYGITTWAPEFKDVIHFGDVRIPRKNQDLDTNIPLVILANPIIYRTEGDDLPIALQGTNPRYFDDPDLHENATVVFGFGDHGLETRLKDVTTEKFVLTVQRHMKEEIDNLMI